jgi:hypothetical protein
MKNPMLVEVIAYAPTAFYHCMHCEVAFREMGKSDKVQKEQLSSSLPSDLMNDYLALSDWVRGLFQVHDARVVVKVIDAASVEGVFRSLRYGMRRFPAVIVDGKARFQGTDAFHRAAHEIERLLRSPDAIVSAA